MKFMPGRCWCGDQSFSGRSVHGTRTIETERERGTVRGFLEAPDVEETGELR